ncbi:hypothetical protein FRC09_008139 [Ceratobasidium sp. 395]|nr:hypothetical protein FRC09_008139 [Ceratobasidium sp. 395]
MASRQSARFGAKKPLPAKLLQAKKTWVKQGYRLMAEQTVEPCSEDDFELRVMTYWTFVQNNCVYVPQPNMSPGQWKGISLIGDAASLNGPAKYIAASGEYWDYIKWPTFEYQPMVVTGIKSLKVEKEMLFRDGQSAFAVCTSRYMYLLAIPDNPMFAPWKDALPAWAKTLTGVKADTLIIKPPNLNRRPAYWHGLKSWKGARKQVRKNNKKNGEKLVKLGVASAEAPRNTDRRDDEESGEEGEEEEEDEEEEGEEEAQEKAHSARQRGTSSKTNGNRPKRTTGRAGGSKANRDGKTGSSGQGPTTSENMPHTDNGGTARVEDTRSQEGAPGELGQRDKLKLLAIGGNLPSTEPSAPSVTVEIPVHDRSEPATAQFLSTSDSVPSDPPTVPRSSGDTPSLKRSRDDDPNPPTKRPVRSIYQIIDNGSESVAAHTPSQSAVAAAHSLAPAPAAPHTATPLADIPQDGTPSVAPAVPGDIDMAEVAPGNHPPHADAQTDLGDTNARLANQFTSWYGPTVSAPISATRDENPQEFSANDTPQIITEASPNDMYPGSSYPYGMPPSYGAGDGQSSSQTPSVTVSSQTESEAADATLTLYSQQDYSKLFDGWCQIPPSSPAVSVENGWEENESPCVIRRGEDRMK